MTDAHTQLIQFAKSTSVACYNILVVLCSDICSVAIHMLVVLMNTLQSLLLQLLAIHMLVSHQFALLQIYFSCYNWQLSKQLCKAIVAIYTNLLQLLCKATLQLLSLTLL